MTYYLPGDCSRALLARGMPYLRDGLRYEAQAARSAARGYAPPAQFIVGRAEGDYVWDLARQPRSVRQSFQAGC